MADADLFAPLSSLQWVDREQLKPKTGGKHEP